MFFSFFCVSPFRRLNCHRSCFERLSKNVTKSIQNEAEKRNFSIHVTRSFFFLVLHLTVTNAAIVNFPFPSIFGHPSVASPSLSLLGAAQKLFVTRWSVEELFDQFGSLCGWSVGRPAEREKKTPQMRKNGKRMNNGPCT